MHRCEIVEATNPIALIYRVVGTFVLFLIMSTGHAAEKATPALDTRFTFRTTPMLANRVLLKVMAN